MKIKTDKNSKTVYITAILFILSLILLSLVYVRNVAFMPLVLHFTNNIGDILGVKQDLLVLIIWFAAVCIVNYFISFVLFKNKPSLTYFVNLVVLILNVLFLILSWQIYMINR